MEQNVTADRVSNAYEALTASLIAGVEQDLKDYWAEDMVWLVPGHNQLSGWKYGRSEFFGFMQRVGELSGGSFHMRTVTILCNENYSCDVTNNQGTRSKDPNKKLNIDVAHVLRWHDGQVVAGKGGIMGNGTAEYDEFWA